MKVPAIGILIAIGSSTLLAQVPALKALSSQPDMVSGGDVLDQEPARHMITMPEGSWGDGGYHYIWINDNNVWTWEKLYVIERKLRQMAREYAGGPAHRIVVQAAREMLLAEASDWQFLISTFSARDYSEIRFSDHVERFDRLAALADKAHAGGKLGKSDAAFLEECEAKDAPFQELDLSLWKTIPEPASV